MTLGAAESIFGREPRLEQLLTGFSFTEGPAWCDAGDFLVFSDIPGDAMWRWAPSSGLEEYRRPSRMANGNTYDNEGRLISCEHASSRVVIEAEGAVRPLAAKFGDKELNSPNDVVVAKDGSIFFTDPTYGRGEFYGVPRAPELGFRGLYRLRPGDPRSGASGLELLADDFDQPNGLCFSPDEAFLFVNDTERMHIRCFAKHDDGSLSGGDVWAEVAGDGPGGPDGMKVDAEGNVYCTGPGGIHVFSPAGSHLGRLAVPEVVGNFAWGGRQRSTLFICASTSVYRTTTRVPGHRPG